jgi:RimJ/RimL family protein N-acetyltransferase
VAYRFERTFDLELVRLIVTEPRTYNAAGDDDTPPRELYQVPDFAGIWYVLTFDDDELLGLFAFIPQSSVHWALHSCLLPGKWFPRGPQALRALCSWIWERSTCRRISAAVRLRYRTKAANEAAQQFVRQAGFTEYGRNPRSTARRGRLFDQALYGISKP